MDVVLGANGSLRTRQGYENHTTGAAAAEYSQLYAHSDTVLLARRSAVLAAIDTTGAEATTVACTDAFVHAVQIGTPTASYSYISDGTLAVKQFDGSAFTSGAALATVDGVGASAMPIGKYLAATGSSNRLVVAGTTSAGAPGGGAGSSSTSHVWFSDPGAPTTWDTNNYVMVDPGDGEDIVGVTTWNDQVFVFKKTKLFVFYGEDQDANGDPIFLNRKVHLGSQAECLASTSGAGNPSVTAGPDGVYYVGTNGVWVTTGDAPVSISRDRLAGLEDSPSPDVAGDADRLFFDGTSRGISHHFGNLYLSYQEATGGLPTRTAVCDLSLGGWVKWNSSAKGFTAWKAGSDSVRLFSAHDGTNHVMKWASKGASLSTDDGTAITGPSYTTGYWDLGLPGEKVVREVEVWGVGSAVIGIDADWRSSATTETVTFGNSATNRHIARIGTRGNRFAITIADNAGDDFRIDRIILHLLNARDVGAKAR